MSRRSEICDRLFQPPADLLIGLLFWLNRCRTR